MTAQVVDIHDFLPTSVSVFHDEPCPVVVLPVIRIERCPDGRQTNLEDAPAELPCDVEG